jgi:hypothetical protein
VRAVYVGIGHDDHFAVTQLRDVEVVRPMPSPMAVIMARISSW